MDGLEQLLLAMNAAIRPWLDEVKLLMQRVSSDVIWAAETEDRTTSLRSEIKGVFSESRDVQMGSGAFTADR
jgi:hypothetical protein